MQRSAGVEAAGGCTLTQSPPALHFLSLLASSDFVLSDRNLTLTHFVFLEIVHSRPDNFKVLKISRI